MNVVKLPRVEAHRQRCFISFHSIYRSIYHSIYLCIYLSIDRSIDRSITLSFYRMNTFHILSLGPSSCELCHGEDSTARFYFWLLWRHAARARNDGRDGIAWFQSTTTTTDGNDWTTTASIITRIIIAVVPSSLLLSIWPRLWRDLKSSRAQAWNNREHWRCARQYVMHGMLFYRFLYRSRQHGWYRSGPTRLYFFNRINNLFVGCRLKCRM
jgi:hypothetical protein